MAEDNEKALSAEERREKIESILGDFRKRVASQKRRGVGIANIGSMAEDRPQEGETEEPEDQ